MRLGRAAIVAGFALGLMSGAAKAAYIIDILEVGPNVIATGNGSFDTHDLVEFTGGVNLLPLVWPNFGAVVVGSGFTDGYSLSGSGPTNFGTGGLTPATSTSGPEIAVTGVFGQLFLPIFYESNTLLETSTSFFADATLLSLGFQNGVYVYTWGSGIHSDSLTVNIGPTVSPVPLPASVTMFGAALLTLGAVGYSMKRKKAATAA